MPRKRTAKNNLIALIEETANPAYVINAENQIVYANPALGEWVGVNHESLTDVQIVSSASRLSKPIENAIRGLSINNSDSSARVFVDRGEANIEFRSAIVSSFGFPNSKSSMRLISVSMNAMDLNHPMDSSPTANEWMQELAKVLSEMDFSNSPACLSGSSLVARQLRMKTRIARRAQANTLIIGPNGSGCEDLARHIIAGFLKATSAETVMPINCSIADQQSIQEAVRRVARNQSADSAHDTGFC
ncbi:MAG: hypothetical protein R3C03_06255 [Pirellulaceae bacterium]